jgi:RecG-like helicase
MTECHCVLLYDDSESEVNPSLQRLKILERTKDGFEIAEADLRYCSHFAAMCSTLIHPSQPSWTR